MLSDVNLHIHAGETVSFVGATGAGKSTIAKLVTRFYDPTAGKVLIDGIDLRDVQLESLRRQLGVVPQEPFLFAGTMRDNILFARPSASPEDVDEAVARVGLSELMERLPEGLDTFVHERGVSLASGERQLLALARAFLAQPRVLVLDEATSNLDLKSETLVERGLDAVLEGRTAIVVAHRLSTAMRADRIAVVDAGRIVELGSHKELVDLGGRYAEMYEAWIAHLVVPDVAAEVRCGAGRRDGLDSWRRVAFPNHVSPLSSGEPPKWPSRSRSSTIWCWATRRTSRPTSARRAERSSTTAATRAPSAARPSSSPRDLGTTGVVRSFAIVHQAAPNMPVPYVSTVVDLDGGGSREGQPRERRARPQHGLARNESAAHHVRGGYG